MTRVNSKSKQKMSKQGPDLAPPEIRDSRRSACQSSAPRAVTLSETLSTSQNMSQCVHALGRGAAVPFCNSAVRISWSKPRWSPRQKLRDLHVLREES